MTLSKKCTPIYKAWCVVLGRQYLREIRVHALKDFMV